MKSGASRKPLWKTGLLGLLWVLWLIPVVHTTYLSEKYTVPCPIADDWVLVGQYLAKPHMGQAITWSDLMESYVHSRSPIPKALGIWQAELSQWDVKWGTRTTLLLTLATLLAVIWLIIRTPWLGTWEKPLFAAFAAFFIFSPFQQTQWLVGALASNTMGITPVIVCIALWFSRMPLWAKFGLSLALSIFTSLSFIAGLVIWLFPPVLIWFTQPAPSWKVRLGAIAGWLALFVLCIGLYFHGLEAGQSSIGLGEAMERWRSVLGFILSVIGTPVSFQPHFSQETVAVIMACCFIALLVVAAVLNYRYFLTAEGFRTALPWLAFLAFGVGNAILLALGRLDVVHAAFFTRYAAYTAFFFIGWLGIMRLAVSRQATAPVPARWGLGGGAAALLAVALWFYGYSYKEGVVKSEFKHYATMHARGAIQFVEALPDPDLLWTAAWDEPHRIIKNAPVLAKAGMLGPGLVPSPLLSENRVVPVTDAGNEFMGSLEEQETTPEGGLQVTGWCMGKEHHVPADLVVLTACPLSNPAAERVVSISMARVRRKDLAKKYDAWHMNGRYGWNFRLDYSAVPNEPCLVRSCAFDTDTLTFHRLEGELAVSPQTPSQLRALPDSIQDLEEQTAGTVQAP